MREGGAFIHGVASGDPLADRVVIWTRVTTEMDTVDCSWTVARDPALRDVVAAGEATTGPDTDHTVKVDVTGLDAGETYFYGFSSLGERSPVARTRTLPTAGCTHLRLASVSCAKYNAGFFNVYGRIADREDLDFVLHLGDYIYEASNTPPKTQTPGADIGRPFDPPHECVTLADYRRRYAHYRLDPDVQRLHLVHPLIGTVDDHEFADGAWRDGSVEHRPERDGPWSERRAAAFRARWEWMPARQPDPSDPFRVFRAVELGGLADLILLDTRSRRDQPIAGPAMLDPARSQLGHDQERFLLDELERSRGEWRILANSSVLAQIWDERFPEAAKKAFVALKMINAEGAGPDPDQWDGYPAERNRILAHIRDRGIVDLVVLSGDVHIAMANDLRLNPLDPGEVPLAAEFVTASLTSQNIDDKFGWGYRTRSLEVERAVTDAIPHIRWCDIDSHGYVLSDITPERVVGQWWFVDTVLRRTDREVLGATWMVERGRPGLVPVER